MAVCDLVTVVWAPGKAASVLVNTAAASAPDEASGKNSSADAQGSLHVLQAPGEWLRRVASLKHSRTVDLVALWLVAYLGSAPPETDAGRPAGTHRLMPRDVELLVGAAALLTWVSASRRAQRWLMHPALVQLGRVSLSTYVLLELSVR